MPDRIKKLDKVYNFRDFGGYDVEGGGKVKRDVLFRSAHLSDVTDSDKAFLDTLGIDFHLDLRRQSERESQPNAWTGDVLVENPDPSNDVAPHVAALAGGGLEPDGARDFLRNYYKTVHVEDNMVDLYRRWFRALDEKDGAALIHCAAGKDRTGVGCAVTLTVLGVDEDTVFEDYLKTNAVINFDKLIAATQKRLLREYGSEVDGDALYHLFSVHEDYLNNTFDEMDEAFGSVLGYAEQVLGVNEAMRNRLRERLVVS